MYYIKFKEDWLCTVHVYNHWNKLSNYIFNSFFYSRKSDPIRQDYVGYNYPPNLKKVSSDTITQLTLKRSAPILLFTLETHQSWYDMNGRSQMQGGKNWILPKETHANRFFWLLLARNLEKSLMSLYGTEWREHGYGLRKLSGLSEHLCGQDCAVPFLGISSRRLWSSRMDRTAFSPSNAPRRMLNRNQTFLSVLRMKFYPGSEFFPFRISDPHQWI